MPRKTPSFVRDPDQAAELAALLLDAAEDAETDRKEADDAGEFLSRAARAQHDQAIGRWRRWAAELVAPVDEPVAQPLQIRPARPQIEQETG